MGTGIRDGELNYMGRVKSSKMISTYCLPCQSCLHVRILRHTHSMKSPPGRTGGAVVRLKNRRRKEQLTELLLVWRRQDSLAGQVKEKVKAHRRGTGMKITQERRSKMMNRNSPRATLWESPGQYFFKEDRYAGESGRLWNGL